MKNESYSSFFSPLVLLYIFKQVFFNEIDRGKKYCTLQALCEVVGLA